MFQMAILDDINVNDKLVNERDSSSFLCKCLKH